MSIRVIAIILVMTASINLAWSSDESGKHVHGSHAECPLPKTALDVLRCAQQNHPDVQRAKLRGNQSKGLLDLAGQFQNPEIEVKSVSGKIEGEKKSENKVALLIPIEVGGKRSARKFQAESQGRVAEAELLEVQSAVTIETVKKLHRLRQLVREKDLLQEAINTFTQVINQQKSRPGLAPEQKVSLSVFRMALSEAKIRQSELFEEERALEHYFHIVTGHSLEELNSILPEAPKKWPSINGQPQGGLSPRALLTKAELDLSLAEVQSARAESWPELKLGPMFQEEREGQNKGSIYGFQLSMELPIFSFNGGGRNYARLGENLAKRNLELTRSEEDHEREEQVKVYERTVQILKDSLTPEELEKEHRAHEGYARRGLVSASLVIESHRQIEELTKSRHSRELRALESLWSIYNIDGRILSENL